MCSHSGRGRGATPSQQARSTVPSPKRGTSSPVPVIKQGNRCFCNTCKTEGVDGLYSIPSVSMIRWYSVSILCLSSKEAVQEVAARLQALADQRRRKKQAKRGLSTLAYRHEFAESCTSDSSAESDKEEGEGGRAGLGRTSSAPPAISPSPPLNSSGEIRHGHLLPRSLSAGWAAFKTAQKSTWSALWALSPTGGQLCAVASSPPGPAFSHLHSTLSHCQSTLLTRLRTGACDLGAYKAHFEP
jgi:hypothetical protein